MVNSESIALVMVTVSVVLLVIIWITAVIGRWRLFTKAGVPGWKSIVPVVSGFEEYKLCWNPIFFWLTLVLSAATGYFQDNGESSLLVAVTCAIGLVNFMLLLMKTLRLARAFGKTNGFGVLLTLFPYIFYLVLGFGKAEYVGNTTVNT